MGNKRLRFNRNILVTLALVPALTFVGCGGGVDSGNGGGMESAAPAADPEPVSGGTPRVFFVTPQDGADISSDFDLELEFGAENYEISPIPEEFESPRPDVGHYHLGVNTGCLAVGEVIPQGEGWVHFGDGSNTFTLQVEAGAYQLTVQIGDDEHRTQDGLCESIDVDIADGI